MTSIGIVGTGISGLQLALRLQQLGIEVVVYSAQELDQLASGRPRNFPARFGPTQRRETRLDVFDWEFADAQVRRWDVAVRTDERELTFHADLRPPSSVVDFRIYLPHLCAKFVDRGGKVVVGARPIAELAERHDLMVVANGDRSMRELFPRDETRSVFDGPQRILCSGLYYGISEEMPNSLDLYLLAGIGEILRMPFLSPQGRADVLAFEAVPGGPLEAISHVDSDADPEGFHRDVLALLGEFTPRLRERIDARTFALIGPGEVAQGGVTPVVRRGWARLPDGKCAIAIGDAWITNDPLTAQGANLGSHTAFELADLIARTSDRYDERFCRAASEQLWVHARNVVEWSAAFLGPPPAHTVGLFEKAAEDKRIAEAFVNNFNDPVAQWRTLSSPMGTESFLAGFRAE
ncbi:styrene monooxygenase/indole monooxygenase family protein [Nocardia pseudobrasiliensis]|uniref:2-polyprenyl-6-methoxyphenol hydroxylase-like FAD-dependent oxidoreductase n=1 Tax=Nocardia pseudobrasiliensis TaxID=45979 RepID=A0A370IC05_9NOCA|nr:styrene monooxygenase/indole monooxygenase family protein [Nocardia pseudobrasiliensis]RDI68237.1 2-polyprenyl-6-methoxyphenol hydroxylase-like FAD-dependent oxidoreductase [Nocardia pseudobrasiliensis]